MRHPWIIRDRGAACRQRGHGNLWTEAVTQHYSYRLGNPETQRGILSEQWPLEPGRRMPELHLGEEILVPDLAGWSRERMPELPDTAYFTLAPDWTCEVLSASTRKHDLQRKRPLYAREGVPHLWLIDPVDRTLEAFELHDGQWLLIASAQDDEPVSIRPFDAITFSLGELWD